MLLATTGLFVAQNVASATVDLARVVQFDIPAQTLGAALLRFSAFTSSLQIGFAA